MKVAQSLRLAQADGKSNSEEKHQSSGIHVGAFSLVDLFLRDLKSTPSLNLICLFFVVPEVLGLELGAYTLGHSSSLFFVKGFFKIGSRELFAQAGFESQSS
jgi:hypothetical protein